jgi:hypothetical protein
LNTTEPSAAVDTLYEDLGHAGINGKFLLELKNNGYLDLIDY